MEERQMTKTLYLCDGKKCDDLKWCKCRVKEDGSDLCMRTADPNHAKNGPCEDPQNYPERFDVSYDNGITYYIEKEE